jgi:hypothetical protein
MNLDWEGRQIWGVWLPLLKIYFRGDYQRNAWRVYHEHNALVRGSVSPDRFLEWDVTQGWEPLCKFLDKPIPEEPFPSGNTVDQFFDTLMSRALEPRIKRSVKKIGIATTVLIGMAALGVARWYSPGFGEQILNKLNFY